MTAPSQLDATRWASSIEDLARVGASAVSSGLVVATGGNLSVRAVRRGGGPETFLITAAGSHLDRLDATTITELRMDGSVVAGPPPSTEWRLHQRTYGLRPDVNAIVHVHPAYAVLLDALERPIRLLTLDHVAYVPKIARIPFHPNGSDALADAAAEAAAECDAVILAHHGCSALGPSLDTAYRVAVNLESAAQATYRMLLLGDETTEFPNELRANAIHRETPPAP